MIFTFSFVLAKNLFCDYAINKKKVLQKYLTKFQFLVGGKFSTTDQAGARMTFARLGFGMGNGQAFSQLLGLRMGMKIQFPNFGIGIGNEQKCFQPNLGTNCQKFTLVPALLVIHQQEKISISDSLLFIAGLTPY